MDKRTYLAWLQSTQAPQQNEGWKKAIDMVQTAGDVLSFGASFVPGGNFVGSAIDTVSAGVDLAQGDYVDSAFRGGAAAAGLIPGGGAIAKTAQAAKAAKAAKAVKAVETGVNVAKDVSSVAKAVKGVEGAASVAKGVEGAASVAKGVEGTKTAAGTTKVFTRDPVAKAVQAGQANAAKGAVQAARTGTQGAQAVAKGSEAVAAAAKPSLLGRTTQAIKTGARTTVKTAAKVGQAANDYGAARQSNATVGDQYQPYPKEKDLEFQRDFLAPVAGEVQSNLVSQGTQATQSRKRDNSMDPAFSYRGAYGMFRPVGYGMNENTLNKMVNNHVNKFLKSKKGKELKSEVKDIAKKRVD